MICQSFFSNFSKISKNFFGTAVLGVKIAPSREPDLVDDFAISPFQERTGSKKLSYPSCAGALYSPCELYAAFCLIDRTRGVSVCPAFSAPRNEMIFNKVIPPLKIVSAALGINLKFSFITSFPLVSHIIPNLMYMLYADLAYQKYDISYRFFNIPAGTPPTTV